MHNLDETISSCKDWLHRCFAFHKIIDIPVVAIYLISALCYKDSLHDYYTTFKSNNTCHFISTLFYQKTVLLMKYVDLTYVISRPRQLTKMQIEHMIGQTKHYGKQ